MIDKDYSSREFRTCFVRNILQESVSSYLLDSFIWTGFCLKCTTDIWTTIGVCMLLNATVVLLLPPFLTLERMIRRNSWFTYTRKDCCLPWHYDLLTF